MFKIVTKTLLKSYRINQSRHDWESLISVGNFHFTWPVLCSKFREKIVILIFLFPCDHLEESLDTGLDLAGVTLRVICLDLEEGDVPVFGKVLLEHAGLDIVGVAADPSDVNNAIGVILLGEFCQKFAISA